MMIPATIISLATFPGQFVHQIVVKFFCDRAKVPVYEECYFRIGNPTAYIMHEHPKSVKIALLITFGPFIVSTILCSLITFPNFFGSVMADAAELDFFLMWIGVSVGMQALPRSDELKQLQSLINRDGKRYMVSHFLTAPFKIANAFIRIILVLYGSYKFSSCLFISRYASFIFSIVKARHIKLRSSALLIY